MNKIEILAQELANSEYAEIVATQNYPAIAQLLNQNPLINNPTPQGVIPKPLSLLTLLDAVTQAELLSIKDVLGSFDGLGEIARTNDRPRLIGTLALIRKALGESFSQSSTNNIQALINETIPDPNYQSQIPGQSRAEELNIYPIDEHDVQAALNPYIPLEPEE